MTQVEEGKRSDYFQSIRWSESLRTEYRKRGQSEDSLYIAERKV